MITYNGVDLSSYLRVTDVRGRGINEVEFNELTVPGRDGSYFVSKRKPKRIIENDYKISASTQTELRQKIDELNAILDVNQPVPIEYVDEPGKTYYGMAYSDGQSQQILSYEKGTLYFVCFDPHKYGPAITQTINDPLGSEANPVVLNDGTAETYPIFTATILQPTTFLQIVSPDAYMQVGQPANVDQSPVDGDVLVLQDEMTDLSKWQQATRVFDGVVQGSFKLGDNTFVVDSFGPSYDGWAGPALKRALDKPLQDFKVHALVNLKNTVGGVGRIEVYGLDANNNVIFRVAIGDYYSNTKRGRFYYELGEEKNLIANYYGKNNAGLNDYYGSLAIQRKGNEWYGYTARRIGESMYVDYFGQSFIDTDNKYTAELAQVQIHIGSNLNHEDFYMSFNHMFIYELHDRENDQIPYIAYPGDVIEFDHKKALIRKNGEIWMQEKDFSASFFPLAPGYTELAVNPADAAIVTVEYSPRWK